MNSPIISKSLTLTLVAFMAATLAGCSAGGGGSCTGSSVGTGGATTGGTCTGTTPTPAPPPGTPPPPPPPAAADLIVTVSTPAAAGVKDTGAETATVKVTAVDTNRNVVAGVPVTIVADNTAVVTTAGTVTDATGIITSQVGIGADRSNRSIAVSIVSGSLTKTTAINVYGATLTATATSVLTPGSAGSIQYHLADANAVPMSGVTVSLSGAFTASGPTDSNGNFSYAFTAPTTEQVLTVTASAANLTTSNVITDSQGTIPSAPDAVQSASMEANPGTVGVNTGTSVSNQVVVRALFLGANNKPVTNVRVRFDLDNDPNGIGGSLSSGTGYVYSDATGAALTTYTPGAVSGGSDGVVIRGCWSNDDFPIVSPPGAACPVNQALVAHVTVADQPVSVTVSTDNHVQVPATTTALPYLYKIGFAVQVADSAGHGVPGVRVSNSVVLNRYYKGFYTFSDASKKWTRDAELACDNEDVNHDTHLNDFGNGNVEDANGDGLIEPSSAAVTVDPNTDLGTTSEGLTDAFGRAYFLMTYGSDKSTWLEYTIKFSATVAGGAESAQSSSGTLPAPSTDFTDVPPPAFANSPYGTDASPSGPNPPGSSGPTIPYRVQVTGPGMTQPATLCYLNPRNLHGPMPNQ